MSETIVLPNFSISLPSGPPITMANAISFNFNYTLTGGTFSISVMKDTIIPPPVETAINTPAGRQGVILDVTQSWSRQGLVYVLSGVLAPPYARTWVFASLINTGATSQGLPANILNKTLAARLLSGQGSQQSGLHIPGGSQLSGTLDWQAGDFPTTQFIYRGPALEGVIQLARNMLAEVVVRNNKVIVIQEGKVSGNVFTLPLGPNNIVSLVQSSLAARSSAKNYVIDPGLTAVNVVLPSAPIFDAAHAQKQPIQTVRMGSPIGTNTTGAGSLPFCEIPDGWYIDGDFDDFLATPPSTAPAQYWKLFASPVLPGYTRGIRQFNRIIKDLQATNAVSNFVASPTYQAVSSVSGNPRPNGLTFGGSPAFNGPFSGFNMNPVTFFDAITNQTVTINKPLILEPPNSTSGTADAFYYEATFDLWFFPLIPPYTLPGVGVDPTNPFNVPSNTAIIVPPSQILRFPNGFPGIDFYAYYLPLYKNIAGPRLRTQASIVYRGQLPMPGDSLVITGAPTSQCGRIEAVTFSLTAGSLSVTVTSELYNYTSGLGHVVDT